MTCPTRRYQALNFETWSGEQTVYVINDNNGALFQFEQLTGETWMTRDAVAKVSPTWNPQALAGPDVRALAAISLTDVLIAGVHAWPRGIFADPLRVEGRAALYSLGFIIRRAAAVRLDVADSELKIGLRTTPGVGGVVGQIFLSDTLENGAGYSTQLGAPKRIRTSDLCLRRATLYPAELWVLRGASCRADLILHSPRPRKRDLANDHRKPVPSNDGDRPDLRQDVPWADRSALSAYSPAP